MKGREHRVDKGKRERVRERKEGRREKRKMCYWEKGMRARKEKYEVRR